MQPPKCQAGNNCEPKPARDEGNAVNNICLGCWPSKFLFPNTMENAAPPDLKQTKTFKSKDKIKKPCQNVRFFSKGA